MSNRTEALRKKPKDTLGDRVPLVVTYHPQLPKLSIILRKHLPILHVSERMKQIIPNVPLVAYRRPKNLKDLLVRATLKPPQQSYEGTRQCGRPRCKTCEHIKSGLKVFQRSDWQRIFEHGQMPIARPAI